VRDITLTNNNTYQPQVDIGTVKVGKYTIAGAALDSGGIIYGDVSLGDETKNKNLHLQSEGNIHPDNIQVIPVYLSFAFIIFVGYAP